MIAKAGIGIGLVALLVGVGSYVATVSRAARTDTRPAAECPRGLARWLSLTPEQQRKVEAADPTFAAESRTLRDESDAARAALAETLTRDSASDADVLAATERAIEAHARLERRVARYLLNVRTILTPEQRRRLFELSAEQVRQGCCRGRGFGGPPEGRGGPDRGRGHESGAGEPGGGRRGSHGQGPPWREKDTRR